MMKKKILIFLVGAAVVLTIVGFGVVKYVSSTLPELITVADYEPLLVSEVYARGGEKIGEFFNESRTLIDYDKIPKVVVQAFTAAEDDTFFEHKGINYLALARAAFTNLVQGKKAQGASTITQQVARSILLLDKKKTYLRKIKEILLSYKMEEHLSKKDILYLYLNQIYFGASAHGIVAASDTYFRKKVSQLTLGEAAILAGLPKAPSDYSPTRDPQAAKNRQRYVLRRMAEVGHITKEQSEEAAAQPIQVYAAKEFNDIAPYFVETVRQMLTEKLGNDVVQDQGLRIYTGIDAQAQKEATQQVREGLEEVDKRQGWRGAQKKLAPGKETDDFLLATRKALMAKSLPVRIIKPDGNVEPERPMTIYHKKDASGNITENIPPYIKKNQVVEAVVTKSDDKLGLIYVQFAEGLGLIDIGDIGWARKPEPGVNAEHSQRQTKVSSVAKPGDVILIKVLAEKFSSMRLEKERFLIDKKTKKPVGAASGASAYSEYAQVTLEQEPLVQGALISLDLKTQGVMAMVGGYDFEKNKFNRTIQANRQTGSSFKTIVYAAALDKGYTGATQIVDAPIVFEEKEEKEGQEDDIKKWKPHNHGEKFSGDILFRTALVRSLNIPTVKILESIGVSWVIDYAKRLGLFSPLNADLSLGLGSSSVTLYEMTKMFSHFGRMGRRIRPVMIEKVVDRKGKVLLTNLSLDLKFEKEIGAIESNFEAKRKDFLEKHGESSMDADGKNHAGAKDGGKNAGSKNPNDMSPGVAAATPLPGTAGIDPKTGKKEVLTPKIYFRDPDQLISPQTAYVMTTLLQGTIADEGGTAGRARSLGRPVAGKTGTTNGYFDAWFVGFTPQIATGVWVGFDHEKTLGAGEVGGRAALPIWLEYMKTAHKDQPVQGFQIPSGIVFANVDSITGKLASVSTKNVINQAFIQGTEPTEVSGKANTRGDESDFYKNDLAQ
jgi:penicillin-binding protein 1A